jgi:hypothetical protein
MTGENIYATWNSNNVAYQGHEAVDSWFAEIKDFNTANVDSFGSARDSGVTGHYTQVIWAETFLVGCGLLADRNNGMYRKFVVCNYYVAGNFYNKPIYKRGSPASACAKADTDYNGLCDPR